MKWTEFFGKNFVPEIDVELDERIRSDENQLVNDSSMHNAEEKEDDDDERIIFHLIF